MIHMHQLFRTRYKHHNNDNTNDNNISNNNDSIDKEQSK